MRSSRRVAVAMFFMAPTVITRGSLAGALMVAYPLVFIELLRPWFPAATTTTIPAFQAFSTRLAKRIEQIAFVNGTAPAKWLMTRML